MFNYTVVFLFFTAFFVSCSSVKPFTDLEKETLEQHNISLTSDGLYFYVDRYIELQREDTTVNASLTNAMSIGDGKKVNITTHLRYYTTTPKVKGKVVRIIDDVIWVSWDPNDKKRERLIPFISENGVYVIGENRLDNAQSKRIHFNNDHYLVNPKPIFDCNLVGQDKIWIVGIFSRLGCRIEKIFESSEKKNGAEAILLYESDETLVAKRTKMKGY